MSEFTVRKDLFGRYAKISVDYAGEKHVHKVITLFESNFYCDVPIRYSTVPTLHSSIVPVVNVIHCGVDESKVVRVALSDCELLQNNDPLTREELDSSNGAWVWVVTEEDPEPIHMQINTDSGTVAPSHAEYCTFENYGPGTDGYYGWIAYRRKPGEGEHG